MTKLSIFVILLCSTLGHAAYHFRYQVTVDHTQAGSSDSANFPILVYISSNNDFKTAANGGYIQNTTTVNAQTVPADLIVTTDMACHTQVTAWEVASYSASSGTVEVWVNQGTLSHTVNTVFYICIDNPAVTTYQSTACNTWDSYFGGVYHFANGATLSLVDSTCNANTGTNKNGVTATSGLIDGAANFAGASSQYVDLGSNVNLIGASAGTLEAWVNPTAVPSGGTSPSIFQAYQVSFQLRFVGSTLQPSWFIDTSNNSNCQASNGTALSTGSWYQLVASYDGAHLYDYQNGSLFGTLSCTGTISVGSSSTHAEIGANTARPAYSNGIIEEARWSSTTRSADWITAGYNMEKPSQTMVTLGSRVALGGPRGAQVAESGRAVTRRGLR
jgi:hypothetical protein